MQNPNLLLSMIGVGTSVLLAAVGWIITMQRASRKDTSDKLDAVVSDANATKLTVARIESSVGSLTGRVDDLHRWKNQQQERELSNVREEAAELRRRIEEQRS